MGTSVFLSAAQFETIRIASNYVELHFKYYIGLNFYSPELYFCFIFIINHLPCFMFVLLKNIFSMIWYIVT